MNHSVGYSARPWPPLRNAVETVLQLHRPYTTWGMCEADVTEAVAAIRRLQRQLKCAISFHAYIIYCLAQAAKQHPGVLCFRFKKQLITFDDADISTLIDKRFPGGVRMPAVYTVRQAQNKSLAQINFELRQAMRTGDEGRFTGVMVFERATTKYPTFEQKTGHGRRATSRMGASKRAVGWSQPTTSHPRMCAVRRDLLSSRLYGRPRDRTGSCRSACAEPTRGLALCRHTADRELGSPFFQRPSPCPEGSAIESCRWLWRDVARIVTQDFGLGGSLATNCTNFIEFTRTEWRTNLLAHHYRCGEATRLFTGTLLETSVRDIP